MGVFGMRKQSLGGWALATLVGLASLAPAISFDGEDAAFPRIQAVAPPLPARRLNAQDFQVQEWVLGPQRQRDRKAIRAKTLFSFGDTFYAEEEGTGRWLVGHRPDVRKPTVECDSQFATLQAMLDAH